MISISERTKTTALAVNSQAFRIDVGQQHSAGFSTPSDHLDAPSVASLAQGPGFLLASTFAPVSNGQAQDFSNPCPRLVGDADDQSITQTQASAREALTEHAVQLRVINGMRLPGLMDQLKVVV